MITCNHPPHKLYTWIAYDHTLCVCCCACGSVLSGGADNAKRFILKHIPPQYKTHGLNCL